MSTDTFVIASRRSRRGNPTFFLKRLKVGLLRFARNDDAAGVRYVVEMKPIRTEDDYKEAMAAVAHPRHCEPVKPAWQSNFFLDEPSKVGLLRDARNDGHGLSRVKANATWYKPIKLIAEI